MKIANEEMKFKIYNALKKDYEEEISEEELKKVRSISINQTNEFLEGEKVEEKDFEVLRNVESLTLNLFEITDELIQQINSFENLSYLVLNHCTIRAEKKIRNHLKNIIVTYTQNFKLSLFEHSLSAEMVQLVNLDKIDIKDLSAYKNLEYIYIYNTQLENLQYLENFEKLKKVYLDGSTISEQVLNYLKEKKIKVHYAKEYLPR